MIHVRAYKQLDEFFRAFSTGKVGLMVVKSRGGLGKTQQARDILDSSCFIAGHTTPLALYQQLYVHKDNPIVLDDVDELFQNTLNVSILKQVCDTSPTKLVHYHSTSGRMGNIPDSFWTRSQVLILCNVIREVSGNLGALMTRAHLINFAPSNQEIYKRLCTFASDKEVLGAIETCLGDAIDLNFRHYARAVELKEAGVTNWREFLLEELLPANDKARLMKDLVLECKSDRERIALWPGSRSDFYNWKAKLGGVKESV